MCIVFPANFRFDSVELLWTEQDWSWPHSTGVDGACTVSVMLVDLLTPPPWALMVIVAGPSVAVAVALKETVTVQVGLQGLLVKITVTPVGRLVAEKVTWLVVPPASVAVIVEEGLVDPWVMDTLAGDGLLRVKPNACWTVTVTWKCPLLVAWAGSPL